MDTLDEEILRQDVDALVRELAEARNRHVAGIEPEPSKPTVRGASPEAGFAEAMAARPYSTCMMRPPSKST